MTVTLPSFSVLAYSGGFIAILFVYFRLKKFNFKLIDLILIILCGVTGLFIGSRLLYILSRVPWLIANYSAANLSKVVTRGGIVFYGGLFGFLFAVKILSGLRNYDSASVFKMIVPAIPLFHGFGRIGCFLGGCCFGEKLETPFEIGGLVFTRIPVQLFESVFCFLLFPALLLVEKKYKESDTLRIYLLSYAVFRFVIELLRGDDLRGVYLLSTSQWISLVIIGFYITKWLRIRFSSRRKGIEENHEEDEKNAKD